MKWTQYAATVLMRIVLPALMLMLGMDRDFP